MKAPPFCPNKECQNYNHPPPDWYVRNGTYNTQVSGSIQRYRCRACGIGFSSQTYRLDYFVKRKVSYKSIMSYLVSCSGTRDMSRLMKVSCHLITNRINRLARQAIAVHASILSTLILDEDLVADGFESYVKSQYFPNNIQLLCGQESQYWIFSDYAHLRRKGRMTITQQKKNNELKEKTYINRVTIYQSFSELVRTVLDFQRKCMKRFVNLYTDEHPQYRRVIKELGPQEAQRIHHVRVNSKLPRIGTNPLFPVNYLDREIRKDLAEHVRESVKNGKNAGNSMDRLAVYRHFHNYIKSFRINEKELRRETHASMAGIDPILIAAELKTFFTQRRFLGKIGFLPLSELKVWAKCLATPLSRWADYLPQYVLQ